LVFACRTAKNVDFNDVRDGLQLVANEPILKGYEKTTESRARAERREHPRDRLAIEDFQPVYDWENAADFSTPTVFYRKLNVSSPKQHRAAATGRRFGF